MKQSRIKQKNVVKIYSQFSLFLFIHYTDVCYWQLNCPNIYFSHIICYCMLKKLNIPNTILFNKCSWQIQLNQFCLQVSRLIYFSILTYFTNTQSSNFARKCDVVFKFMTIRVFLAPKRSHLVETKCEHTQKI